MSAVPPLGEPPESLRDEVTAILAAEADAADEDGANDVESGHVGPGFSLGTFLAPYRGRFIVAGSLVAAQAIVQNVGPLVIAAAVDRGVVAKNPQALLDWCGLFLLCILGGVTLASASQRFSGRLEQSLILALRVRAFRHAQMLSDRSAAQEESGRLLSTLTQDIDALSGLFQNALINMAVQLFTLVVMLGALVWLNVSLAGVLSLTVVPALVLATLRFRQRGTTAFLRVRESIARLTGRFQDMLDGFREMVAADRQSYHRHEFQSEVAQYRRMGLTAVAASSEYTAATEVIGLAGQCVVLVAGFLMLRQGTLSVGELVAFMLFTTRFFAPLQAMQALYGGSQAATAALRRVASLLNEAPAIREKPTACDLVRNGGAVVFEGISFAYPGGPTVLDCFDLHVRAGEVVALAGRSGAGKSTVAKLLVRLYDPTAGRVLIDGVDIRELTLSSLRRAVLLVPQEVFLFHATIFENVAFARPVAARAEVERACAAVGLDEVAARLPRGLDSSCHSRGAGLSAGERQLIALARALLCDPLIVVLDEATARVDPRFERHIEQGVGALLRGRTGLLIAHRPQSLRRAERVVQIEAGRIRTDSPRSAIAVADRLAQEHP